jgi:hypothetical protein
MTDNTAPLDMETIRHNCATRIAYFTQALQALATVDSALETAADNIDDAFDGWVHKPPMVKRGFEALGYFNECEADKIREQLRNTAQQYARLLARDLIAPAARNSGDTAVVFITGNRYMPPLREVESCDVIYDAQDVDDMVWELFVEQLESQLDTEHVYMAQPEYDNALYVVDLKRFEHYDDEDDPGIGDMLNDEWKPIKEG